MAIQKVIRGEEQTKFVLQDVPSLVTGGTALTNFVAFSSGIAGVGEIYPALPQSVEGTAEYERIGDVIKPTSIYVDLNIAVKNGPSDAFSTDKIVHIFLLTSKAVKDLSNYTSIPITGLLDNGAGQSVAFDGTSGNSMFPVQKKSFTVLKHWRRRMTAGFGHPIGSTGTTLGNTDSVVFPAASYASVRLKVKVPKKLTYNSSAAIYPNNYAPFFVIGWTRADSAGNSAPSFINTYVQAKTGMYYKDA